LRIKDLKYYGNFKKNPPRIEYEGIEVFLNFRAHLLITQSIEGSGLDGEDGTGLGQVDEDSEYALPLEVEAAPGGGGHVRNAPHGRLHLQPALLLRLDIHILGWNVWGGLAFKYLCLSHD